MIDGLIGRKAMVLFFFKSLAGMVEVDNVQIGAARQYNAGSAGGKRREGMK